VVCKREGEGKDREEGRESGVSSFYLSELNQVMSSHLFSL